MRFDPPITLSRDSEPFTITTTVRLGRPRPRLPLFDIEKEPPWFDVGDVEWVDVEPDSVARTIRHLRVYAEQPGVYRGPVEYPIDGVVLESLEDYRRNYLQVERSWRNYVGSVDKRPRQGAACASMTIERYGGTYSMTRVPVPVWKARLLRPWWWLRGKLEDWRDG